MMRAFFIFVSQMSYLRWCREVEGTQPLERGRADNGGEYRLINLPFYKRAEAAISTEPLAPLQLRDQISTAATGICGFA